MQWGGVEMDPSQGIPLAKLPCCRKAVAVVRS